MVLLFAGQVIGVGEGDAEDTDDDVAGDADEDTATEEVLAMTELLMLEVGAMPIYFAPQMLTFWRASPRELLR